MNDADAEFKRRARSGRLAGATQGSGVKGAAYEDKPKVSEGMR
jgi:hypothetical protein